MIAASSDRQHLPVIDLTWLRPGQLQLAAISGRGSPVSDKSAPPKRLGQGRGSGDAAISWEVSVFPATETSFSAHRLFIPTSEPAIPPN